MKVHSFYIEDAEKHGVEKAVILYNLRFWLEKNKANSSNLHDGYYWTFNSAKAFSVLFPYYKASKIERLLRQMEKDGLILSGVYNKKGYDRTKWYSMPDFKAETLDDAQSSNLKNGSYKNEDCNPQNSSMESSNLKHGIFKSEAPIPDINSDSKPDINTDLSAKKKTPKKLHDIPSDFKPTQKQLDKMLDYGINVELTLETFKSTHQSNGKKFKDWNAALTTWINKKIEWDKLVPLPKEQKGALDDWNARNPDYQPPSHYQEPDVYHPSHSTSQPSNQPLPHADPNWHWKEPLPGMNVAQTEKYLNEHKRAGENKNKAYQRIYAEMQEQGL